MCLEYHFLNVFVNNKMWYFMDTLCTTICITNVSLKDVGDCEDQWSAVDNGFLDVFIRILSLSPTQHSRLQCLWNTECRYTVNKQITVKQMIQLCLKQLISWLTILNNNSNTQTLVILTLKQNKGHKSIMPTLYHYNKLQYIKFKATLCNTWFRLLPTQHLPYFLPVLSFDVPTSSI